MSFLVRFASNEQRVRRGCSPRYIRPPRPSVFHAGSAKLHDFKCIDADDVGRLPTTCGEHRRRRETGEEVHHRRAPPGVPHAVEESPSGIAERRVRRRFVRQLQRRPALPLDHPHRTRQRPYALAHGPPDPAADQEHAHERETDGGGKDSDRK